MIRVLAMGAGLAVCLVSTVVAQPKADPKPGAVVVDVVELKAKVDAVNPAKRLIMVTGPRGNTVVLKAGPEVKNLDQINAGDEIVARHYESVALYVRKGGEPPAAGELTAVEVAPKGAEPGVIAMDTVEVTATVEGIDYKKRTVTLKGPEGKLQKLKVDPSVKRFKEVKKGDQVVARVTEALAISVPKP